MIAGFNPLLREFPQHGPPREGEHGSHYNAQVDVNCFELTWVNWVLSDRSLSYVYP